MVTFEPAILTACTVHMRKVKSKEATSNSHYITVRPDIVRALGLKDGDLVPVGFGNKIELPEVKKK